MADLSPETCLCFPLTTMLGEGLNFLLSQTAALNVPSGLKLALTESGDKALLTKLYLVTDEIGFVSKEVFAKVGSY